MSSCCRSSDLFCGVCVCVSMRVCVLFILCLDLCELYVCIFCLFVCLIFATPSPLSPHAVPDRLRLRVNRISLQEYDRLQYDKERLRDICETKLHCHYEYLTLYVNNGSHDTLLVKVFIQFPLSCIMCFNLFHLIVLVHSKSAVSGQCVYNELPVCYLQGFLPNMSLERLLDIVKNLTQVRYSCIQRRMFVV